MQAVHIQFRQEAKIKLTRNDNVQYEELASKNSPIIIADVMLFNQYKKMVGSNI